jgi:reductive dehalogenase
MVFVKICYLFFGTVICLFFLTFFQASIREKKYRAAYLSILCLIIFGALWFGGYAAVPFSGYLIVPVLLLILFVLLFLMPVGKTSSLMSGKINGRVDERDIMFAREEYHPGSNKYETYYAMRPEKKENDDKLRALPELLKPGGKYYHPIHSMEIDRIFERIEGMLDQVDGKVNSIKTKVDPDEVTKAIKRLTLELGADEAGIARLNPAYIYSHVGRGPEEWGKPIENNHKFAIAYSMEMDYTHVETAPQLPITEETAKNYLTGANIAIALAKHIREMGYPARAHIAGSNYQIMLPPVAYDAGLGELGRHGYLISERFGSRIRLGAVTTDLPLISDTPIIFGVQDFCRLCKKCADNCPSRAIPFGEKENVRGVDKWLLNMEQCLRYWRTIGTDCGLCMKVCPFSHPQAFVHDIVRIGIKRSAFARRVSIHGDDLFYGKKAKY